LHHMVCVIGELLLFLAVLVPSAAAAEPDPFGLPDRFSYYLHRTYSWPRMAWLSMDAGVDYATGGSTGVDELFRGYGDGFGRRIVRNSIEFGLGAVLHEDSRYKSLGTGSIGKRLRYATIHAFQTSVPGSRFRPAYSRFAALAAGELIPPLWSAQRMSAGDALAGIGFGMLGQMQNNYLEEFTPDLKQFGRKIGRKLHRRRPYPRIQGNSRSD
jgi:hypothetical protein